jgi:surface protein
MNNMFYKSQKFNNISSLPKWQKECNNEIILKYDSNYFINNKRIFGKKFVENNKDKCIILREDILYSLSEFYEENNINNKEKKEIEIKLIQIERITDISYMFSDCDSLKYLPDISNLDTSCITNMCYLFNNCKSLEEIPDISKWDTINVIDMSYMFSNCSSLKSLPNICNWNTSNILYINNMFYKCSSLLKLPDISKWNTGKILDMSYMFS